MSKAVKRFFIITSLLALANVILAPMHSEGGGMLTDSAEYCFVRTVGDILMEQSALSLWVVQMTLGVFIPSVVMLASAITRMRSIFFFADTAGIAIWFVNFFRYLKVQSIPEIFDVFTTDVAIGSWLALFIFLINALVLICSKKSRVREKSEPVTDQREPELREERFCPRCGKPRRSNIFYCPRCGCKL